MIISFVKGVTKVKISGKYRRAFVSLLWGKILGRSYQFFVLFFALVSEEVHFCCIGRDFLILVLFISMPLVLSS